MIKKIFIPLSGILFVTWFIMGTSNFLQAVTASYNQTVQIVDSAGNVINGTASAITASYNETVRVVDSTGHVIDSFGGGGSGNLPTPIANDYLVANSSATAVWTATPSPVVTATPFAVNGSPVPATASPGSYLVAGPGGSPSWAPTVSPVATPTITLAGDVTGASNTNTLVQTTHIQQPAMFVGASAGQRVNAAATTGTITTPPGVVNGDLEIVYINLNNTTSSAFTPPAGWAAISSCNTSGNGIQNQAFSHVASGEGGTIAAFTWTTNGSGNAGALAFRNVSAVHTCVANTAASATSFTTTGLTAGSTQNIVVAIGAQPGSGGYVTYTSLLTGQITNATHTTNTVEGVAAISYPITNTTVSGYGFSSGNSTSAAWAGLLMDLTYSSSTTANPNGALTYNEFGGAYLAGLSLGSGLGIGGGSASLFIPPSSAYSNGVPANGGITTLDGNGRPVNLLNYDISNHINIGDPNAANGAGATIFTFNGIQAGGNIAAVTNNITTTTGMITGGTTTGGVQNDCSGVITLASGIGNSVISVNTNTGTGANLAGSCIKNYTKIACIVVPNGNVGAAPATPANTPAVVNCFASPTATATAGMAASATVTAIYAVSSTSNSTATVLWWGQY